MINLKSTVSFPFSIKLMSYNIGFGAGLNSLGIHRAPKQKILENLDAISHNILKENPDILCLQEIDLDSRRSGFINQVQFLSKAYQFPFVVFSKTWDLPWVPYPTLNFKNHFGKVLAGQAIFSKFPILNHHAITFPKPRSQSWLYNYFYLDRVAQFATLKLPHGQNLTICNVHLEAWDKEARLFQSREILKHPTDIIAGDFNTVHSLANQKSNFPDDPRDNYENDISLDSFFEKNHLSECLSSHNNASPDYTFPSDHPNRRLDYIFYDINNLQLQNAFIEKTAHGSDHLPLIANFLSKPLYD